MNYANDYSQYTILRVTNLQPFINPKILFNLFSQFGYVKLIKIANRDEELVGFVQLFDHNECLMIRDYLNGTPLFKMYLSIDLTKYNSIEEIEYFERSDKVKPLNSNLWPV